MIHFVLLLNSMDHKNQYYSSHKKLPFINTEGQHLLEQSKVLVIGAGGLGCPCLLALAGAGIGSIGIADFDTVAVSNLHRQSLYSMEDAGKLKTVIATERLRQYNPFIAIAAYNELVGENNILELLSGYDVIADCTDNFSTRYLINDACVYLNKPLVYGAIHQGEGHLTVFNFQQSATLRCLFPKDENNDIASCAAIGAYNITTAVIGNLMANEAIKIITHQPNVLSGKLMQLNMMDAGSITIAYNASTTGRTKSLERFLNNTNSVITAKAVADKISKQQSFVLLDVRTTEEHLAGNIGGINIPLSTLLQTNAFSFSQDDEIIVYCEKGSRSIQAAGSLKAKGFKNVRSMQGGIAFYRQLSNQ